MGASYKALQRLPQPSADQHHHYTIVEREILFNVSKLAYDLGEYLKIVPASSEELRLFLISPAVTRDTAQLSKSRNDCNGGCRILRQQMERMQLDMLKIKEVSPCPFVMTCDPSLQDASQQQSLHPCQDKSVLCRSSEIVVLFGCLMCGRPCYRAMVVYVLLQCDTSETVVQALHAHCNDPGAGLHLHIMIQISASAITRLTSALFDAEQ